MIIVLSSKNQQRSWKENLKKPCSFPIAQIISDKLQFTDNARFMASSLSNLIDILVEIIHKSKGKYQHDNKNAKRVELNIKIVRTILNIKTLKTI